VQSLSAHRINYRKQDKRKVRDATFGLSYSSILRLLDLLQTEPSRAPVQTSRSSPFLKEDDWGETPAVRLLSPMKTSLNNVAAALKHRLPSDELRLHHLRANNCEAAISNTSLQ
jgi:hypothetical protein